MINKKLTILALVAIMLLAFGASAFAGETYEWDPQNGGTSWNVFGNWLRNGVRATAGQIPGAGDTVRILNAGPVVIDTANTAAIAKLELGADANIRIDDTRQLVLDGSHVTADIDVFGNATITGRGTGYISITNAAAGTADITVAPDRTLTIAVPVEVNMNTGGAAATHVLNKSGLGTLALTSITNPATAANTPVVDVAGGVLSIGRVQLVDNVLNVGAAGTLLLTGTNPIALSQGGQTINIDAEGARVVVDAGTSVAVTNDGGDDSPFTGGNDWTLVVSGDLFLNTADGHSPFEQNPSVTVGGTLRLGDNANAVEFRTLSGTSSASISVPAGIELTIAPTAAAAFEYAGRISGAGGLTFAPTAVGAGVAAFTLSGTNSYTGDTTITDANGSEPHLIAASSSAFGTGILKFSTGNAVGETLAASGDVEVRNDIDSDVAGGIIDVPTGSKLTLTGELFNEGGALVKSGAGELVLDGTVNSRSENEIRVDNGTLTLARQGVADHVDITLTSANSILNLGTPNQRHIPDDEGDDFHAPRTAIIANLGESNKIVTGVRATPYFYVDGTLSNTGARTRIIANVNTSYNAGDRFLVLDTDASSLPALNAGQFDVETDAGVTHPDFRVVHVAGDNGVLNGIALEALNSVTISTPIIGDPSEEDRSVEESNVATHTIAVPVTSATELDAAETTATINYNGTTNLLATPGEFVPGEDTIITISDLPADLPIGLYQITVNTVSITSDGITGAPAAPKTFEFEVREDGTDPSIDDEPAEVTISGLDSFTVTQANLSAFTIPLEVTVEPEVGIDFDYSSASIYLGSANEPLAVGDSGTGIVISGFPTDLAVGEYDIEVTVASNVVPGTASRGISTKPLVLTVTDEHTTPGTPVKPNEDGTVNNATIAEVPGAVSIADDDGLFSVTGLSATVVDGKVVISGEAKDIGTFTLKVTTATGVENVPFEVVANEIPKEIITGDVIYGEVSSETAFEVYIPIDVPEGNISDVKDPRIVITPSGGATVNVDVVPASVARGATEEVYIKAAGTVISDDAKITSVSYRIGVNRYTESKDIALRSTGGGSSGGGCDAGFGAFALAAAAAALVLRKKD